MSDQQQTFPYSVGARHMTFVVVERKPRAEYKSGGDLRAYYWMKEHNIVASVRARKQRGQKLYLFYEVQTERGNCYVAAERAKL